ncbi:MAG: HEAT repeat domain-containing protein [Firmicutes bacterium]|nr:HEAT repeat domain-containing protein [Bacillota bacterium]
MKTEKIKKQISLRLKILIFSLLFLLTIFLFQTYRKIELSSPQYWQKIILKKKYSFDTETGKFRWKYQYDDEKRKNALDELVHLDKETALNTILMVIDDPDSVFKTDTNSFSPDDFDYYRGKPESLMKPMNLSFDGFMKITIARVGNNCVDELMSRVKDGNTIIRKRAMWLLPPPYSNLSPEIFEKIAVGEQYDAAAMAVLILGKIGNPGSVKTIIECSGSSDTKLAECSIYALGETREREAAAILKDILDNSGDSVKKRAAALSLVKTGKFTKSVSSYISSSDDLVVAGFGLRSGSPGLKKEIRKWLRKKKINETVLLTPVKD